MLVYNLARDGRKEGKKSLIPSFCDYFSINYTGSNALTVSLCRNKFIWGAIADYFNIPTPKTVCIKDGEVLGEPFEAQKYIRKEISESASINLSNDSIMNNFEWKNIEKKIFCCKSVFQELKLKSLF
ncbi:TPA: D-alanine--D-alanine ligase [Streptococcus suis]|uniref:Uncharacterized protein n=4 Tax=Streptococcus suis TaxID=1307 RepID=M3V7A0_STRSU|nr:hypothetical protein [Streptococcus suis]AFR00043.1 D-alanine--D-alanine ligase [Streptococcus suis S735]ADV69656.1 D-alanine-D-alanine ligase and related ATP-grasp protein-like protein [Streptococcus suis JS14]AER14747.1 D-alanine-D-alanine ligase and related ATP-grasp protein-like protein [Streptococcus suis SS12]AER43883.1 D-alanine-D-alanine ligase and related ATP-grasp protein-like protein [Streptococcus suis A7]AKG39960.1 D-alanine--D-alanine ligase [Streptococcus suis]